MPYKSEAQRAFFHAAEKRGEMKPSVVKEFDEASKGLELPKHVEMHDGGPVCLYCGGSVDAKGYSSGGEVQTSDGEEKSSKTPSPMAHVFAAADKKE